MQISSLTQVATNGKLPARYEAAKAAISECAKVDECKTWADKAAALASYARQVKDESLERTAQRIKVRAIRRAGELLKQIESAPNRPKKKGGGAPTLTKAAAAQQAGLSRDQKVDALRIASIPEETFEGEVESDKHPTVARFSAMGVDKEKRARAINHPPNFIEATKAIEALEYFAERHCSRRPALIAGGIDQRERRTIAKLIDDVVFWLSAVNEILKKTE